MKFKRAITGLLGLVLGVFLLAYIFRLPLTSWYLTPVLSANGIELHCIDWSLTRKLDLKVEKLCLTYQGQQLEVAGIRVNKQQIIISRANLTINSPLSKSDNQRTELKKLALDLPKQRPLINIEQLDISSGFSAEPVRVTVQENSLNHFTVSRDINADVTVTGGEIVTNIMLNDELAGRFIALPKNAHFSTDSQIKFDGITLNVASSVTADYQHEHQHQQNKQSIEHCDFSAQSRGQVTAEFQLNQQQLTADLSGLKNQVVVSPICLDKIEQQQYKEFAQAHIPLTWHVQFTQPIALQQKQLSLPELELTSSNEQGQLVFKNTQLALDAPLKTLYSHAVVNFTSDEIDKLMLKARIEAGRVNSEFQLSLASLPDFIDVLADGVSIKGEVELENILTRPIAGNLNADISVKRAQVFDAKVTDLKTKINVHLSDSQNVTAKLNSAIKSATYKNMQMSGLTNELTVKSDLSVGELFADISATSKLAKLVTPKLTLTNLSVVSNATQSRALQATHHVFVDGIEALITHHMSKVAHPFELVIPEQAMSKLNPILKQFEPLATLTDGVISGLIKGDVNLLQASGDIRIAKLSALYNDYLANDFNTQVKAEFSSGQLNIAPTKFTLNELRAGAVVTKLQGLLQVDANQPCTSNVTGLVMGGAFVVNEFCPLATSQTAMIKFENIDASKLVTLDAESGISLSGRLAGTLPVIINEQGIAVKQGQLVNQGDGKLLITNNAGFEAVKAQQQELSTTLSLLENLDIKQLKSSVDLKPDGWLHLGVNLQGFNEKQQQAVNFNYNHEENVFTLLRALRLSDEITQKVEKEYAKKGSNNG